MKLAIGLLLSNGFPVPVPFFLSYVQLFQRLQAGLDNAWLPSHLQVTSATLIHSQGFPVDAARNDVVRKMLSSDADYLLFLDADMTHPADLPAKLLRHDVPLVTARYHMRRPPHHTCAMRWVGPNAFDCAPVRSGSGLMPVEFAGAGALLIRRDVLEAMRESIGENWFRYSRQTREPFEFTISEDMHFFWEARKAHFLPYLDWDTVCGHLGMFEIDGTWHAAYMDQIDERARSGGQGVSA